MIHTELLKLDDGIQNEKKLPNFHYLEKTTSNEDN